jgi:FMN phosphatase YigB (HAD superfamily)
MKYLAIDIGNVICHMKFDAFLQELAIVMHCSKSRAFDLMYRIQKVQDLGILSIREELAETLSPEIIDLVVEKWNKTLIVNEFIQNALLDLLSQNVQIALLSNIGTEHAGVIRSIISPQIFDNCIKFFSCDVGARKPSYLYYKTFLDMYPSFNGCVYVDDRPENIETGINFGLQGCLFDLETFKSKEDMHEMFEAIELLTLKN